MRRVEWDGEGRGEMKSGGEMVRWKNRGPGECYGSTGELEFYRDENPVMMKIKNNNDREKVCLLQRFLKV